MRFLFLFLALFPSLIYAEESLCQDPLYPLLAKKQSSLTSSLFNLLDKYELEQFQENDKNWNTAMSHLCITDNCDCLIDQYQQRNLELSQKLKKVIAESKTKIIKFTGEDSECTFNTKFPKELVVFAAGDYSSDIKSTYRIGEKGENASIFKVTVNSPKAPIALILGSYNASIWDISWTEGTKIEAVFTMGYHEQALSGLSKTVPAIIKNARCDNFHIGEHSVNQINPLSNKLFKKNADKVFFSDKGVLNLGDPIADSTLLFTSLDTPIESLHRSDTPLRGDEALNDAVSKGILRKLTQSDIDRWLHMIEKPNTNPPVAGVAKTPQKRYFDYQLNRGYVILKPFTFPEDLYGGHAATFFLENGIPSPLGDMGHSSLHNFNTGQCKGHSCIQK